MEEKKLTDEEIVKALETCKNGRMLCQECPCFIKDVTCICSSDEDIDTVLDFIHRLQGEIERLTEELELANETIDWQSKRYEKVSIERREALDRADDFEDKNTELQKQVDELKEERENMQAEIMATEEARLQAVKDTAKEILSRLKCYGDRDEALRRHLLEIEDDYGVEVE